MESNRFLIVPSLSSAARMPFPSATSARAVVSSSVIVRLLLALSIPEQRLYPRRFLSSRRDDATARDPPGRMDLRPVVRRVPDARADDRHACPGLGDRHDCPVL